MRKPKRKPNVGKQSEKDCALTAEVFGLCCKICEDLLVSIVGNSPGKYFVAAKESVFDRSSLLSEINVENALQCFKLVILKTIAKHPDLCKESRFEGHDALFYIKGLGVLWQTTFSALKRTLAAPKCLIVSEHAMAKALAEIEHLYLYGERRYSCKDVREAFQDFLKTLPDLATALAQHDYRNPFGGVGSRSVRGKCMLSVLSKKSGKNTKGEPLLGPREDVTKNKHDVETECSMSDEDYEEILKIIKNTAMTWERTPASYQHMGEDDLRNVLLGSLNSRFPGRANGETFRKCGKTDICIEARNRTAFVAECKMWTGKGAVPKALKQLDSYLTWRDCKAALIYFVDRKDFLAIVDKMPSVLSGHKDLQDLRVLDRNEFVCHMPSTRTPGHLINIRVLLFNLHSDEDKKGGAK